MTFDKPQWLWRSAPAIEDYGYVRGAVYIYPERGRNTVAAVVVPSEFFQFLLGVLSEDDKKLASAKGVRFFLDDLGGGRWGLRFHLRGRRPLRPLDLHQEHFTRLVRPGKAG